MTKANSPNSTSTWPLLKKQWPRSRSFQQNQIVRWTVNKESHAQKIQDEVSAYFLAQRVKLPEAGADKDGYFGHLELLHQITVYAMKCKQTTDAANVAALKKSLASYQAAYFKK